MRLERIRVKGGKAKLIEVGPRLPPAQIGREPRALHRRETEIHHRLAGGKAVGRAGVDALALRRVVEAAFGAGFGTEAVVELARHAGQARGAEHRARQAERQFRRAVSRAGALAADQVDHAADGAGAVQARHRPAHHLDSFEVVQRVGTEIERAARIGRVVHRHAVTQHQHVVGIGAAHEHAGIAAGAAGLHHPHAGDGTQCLGQRGVAALLDGRAVDDRDARRNLLDRRRHPRGGDHDIGQSDALSVGRRVG